MTGPPELPTQITDKVEVDENTGCWLWQGSTSGGYGKVWWQGQLKWAHRLTYELIVGPIPKNKQLGHRCHVRQCVNPHHVRPLSVKENAHDAGSPAAWAVRTHCVNGHEWTSENTRLRACNRGTQRVCLACRREVQRRYEERKAAK